MPAPKKLDTKQLTRLMEDIAHGVPVPILAKTYEVSIPYIYKFKRELEADKVLAAKGIEGAGAPAEMKGRSIGICGCMNGYYRRYYLDLMRKQYPDNASIQDQGDPQELLHNFERFEGEKAKHFCSTECYKDYVDNVDLRMFPTKAEGGKDWYCKEFREWIIKTNERFFPESDFESLEAPTESEELPDFLKG